MCRRPSGSWSERRSQDHYLKANGVKWAASSPVSYFAEFRPSFSRPNSVFFAVAAIPAARSFLIRLTSFSGTGLVSGNWTVPFAAIALELIFPDAARSFKMNGIAYPASFLFTVKAH